MAQGKKTPSGFRKNAVLAVAKKGSSAKSVKKTSAKKPISKTKGCKTTSRSPVKKGAAIKSVAKKPAGSRRVGLPEKMLAAALKVLKDRQGEDILSIDLKGRSTLADYAVVASGRSGRQLAALADHLCAAFAVFGGKSPRVEGLPQADWVLVDAGDIIVHLFKPDVRAYYRIEDIWSAKSPAR